MAYSNNNIVGVHYMVGRKIGQGSFGVIFEGTNLVNNQEVAIKFESRKSNVPQLQDEYRTYKVLVGCPGIPNLYYFGQEGLHNILVMDLLGPSLEDLFNRCGRRFSIKTVVMIAKQMLSRVQAIHENNFIYRDIKPDNFVIGRPGSKADNIIHVIDFGMARQYRDPKTKEHIPYSERKSLFGTARYMSINTHLGREQSRRDDLEAMGHVLMYFLRGELPWQGLKAATNKQKYEKIGEKKQTTQIRDLCEGFPAEFSKYLTYVRNLGFEDTPNYEYLNELLTMALKNTGEVEDGQYDWIKITQTSWTGRDEPLGYAMQQDPNFRPRPSAIESRGSKCGDTSPSPKQASNFSVYCSDAAQPLRLSPIQTNKSRPNDWVTSGAQRDNGAGGLQLGMVTPTASGLAQFHNGHWNLTSTVPHQSPVAQLGELPREPQPVGIQKFMTMLCCGKQTTIG